jgi:hypothetical protein
MACSAQRRRDGGHADGGDHPVRRVVPSPAERTIAVDHPNLGVAGAVERFPRCCSPLGGRSSPWACRVVTRNELVEPSRCPARVSAQDDPQLLIVVVVQLGPVEHVEQCADAGVRGLACAVDGLGLAEDDLTPDEQATTIVTAHAWLLAAREIGLAR